MEGNQDDDAATAADGVSITTNPGTKRTKVLLLRLCNLEERLLSREIELQRLKLDLHSFELHSVFYPTESGAVPASRMQSGE